MIYETLSEHPSKGYVIQTNGTIYPNDSEEEN